MPPQTENDPPGLPPLSLRQSAFFYFGILPIVILLWAWTDSVENHSNWFHRLKAERSRSLILENSTFRTELVSPGPNHEGFLMPPLPFYGGIYRFGANTPDATGRPMPIFPAFLWRTSEADRLGFHVRIFTVSLWFILAGYLPLWLGISYGLARRKRRKLLAEIAG